VEALLLIVGREVTHLGSCAFEMEEVREMVDHKKGERSTHETREETSQLRNI